MANAIIFAAGLGRRLEPLTNHLHKALIPVNGVPILEHTIQQLQDAQVGEITIVVGHRADDFEFLRERYGIQLIRNPHYREYNNIYSFMLARDHLADTFLLDGDLYWLVNPFRESDLSHSHVVAAYSDDPAEYMNEWAFAGGEYVERMMFITQQPMPLMSGITYLTRPDSAILNDFCARHTFSPEQLKKLYWDDLLTACLDRIRLKLRVVPAAHRVEVDELSDLAKLTDVRALLRPFGHDIPAAAFSPR